jgi:hypothetical protein
MTSGLDRALGHAKQRGRLGDRVPPIEEGNDDIAMMRRQPVDGQVASDGEESGSGRPLAFRHERRWVAPCANRVS